MALWRLREESGAVVPGLVALLWSEDERVLYGAITTLQEIGEPARCALPRLRELQRTNAPHALAIRKALRVIGGNPERDQGTPIEKGDRGQGG